MTDKIKWIEIRYLPVPLRSWIPHFEGGVTGPARGVPEEKWILGGGIEIPCTYKVYGWIDQKSYLCKKIKGTK